MWEKAWLPGSKPDGTPILSVIGKRTYSIAPGSVEVADDQIPVNMADQFADPDNQMYSEVLAETDLIPWKHTTDVIVQGQVHAPRGKRAYHIDCTVRVGPLGKTVRVFGKRTIVSRTIRGASISDPEPFTSAPLGYAHSYGGFARDKKGTLFSYYPNPIGKGFAIKGGFEDPADIPLPHLEDPSSPVTIETIALSKFEDWTEAPRPASLGWTRRNFYPRYTYVGILPEFLEAVTRDRDEMAKKDPAYANVEIPRMDFRAFQGASEGLYGKKLTGNEPVSIQYMDPDTPTFAFNLPGEVPTISLDIGQGSQELEPALQTVVIDMENKTLQMVWRGAMEYGGVEELGMLRKIESEVRNES